MAFVGTFPRGPDPVDYERLQERRRKEMLRKRKKSLISKAQQLHSKTDAELLLAIVHGNRYTVYKTSDQFEWQFPGLEHIDDQPYLAMDRGVGPVEPDVGMSADSQFTREQLPSEDVAAPLQSQSPSAGVVSSTRVFAEPQSRVPSSDVARERGPGVVVQGEQRPTYFMTGEPCLSCRGLTSTYLVR